MHRNPVQFWKSNPNYFCEYCKVWMADNPQVRAIHENGVKHKANVAKKVSDIQRKSVQEQHAKEATERAMASISKTAQQKYEQDKVEEEAHRQKRLGSWVFQEDSGYLYNAQLGWHFDLETKLYYGGQPAEWTKDPQIPIEARHATDPKRRSHNVEPPRSPAGLVGGTSTAKHPKHPLAGIGGYQMPKEGRIGGAKGIGHVDSYNAGSNDAGKKGSNTRKRNAEAIETPVSRGAKESKEEADFRARREAARQRVQARTMAAFGLK